MITLIFTLIFSGAIIGGLGRLVVPGRNPMGFFATVAVGIGGAMLGGLVGRIIFGFRYRYAFGFGFVLAVLGAALIVVLLERSRRQP